MTIFMKPTGNIIRGHVLDCAVGPLVERLRDLDPQLYVRWEAKKLRGWGCWAVRRRPENKTLKDVVCYGGNTYVVVDYVENNFENHIIDVPFLNYEIITKLKSIDTWANHYRGKNFVDQAESRADDYREQEKAKALEDRRYALKQQRSAVRDLMNFTLSGGDPSQIANHWGKAGSQT